jgi:hypothetical protein
VDLTVAEVRRLLWRLILGRHLPPPDAVLRWSVWRRHQAAAQRCHYKRRGVLLV